VRILPRAGRTRHDLANAHASDDPASERITTGEEISVLRVSLGLAGNFADVEHFLTFAAGFRDQTTLTIGAVTFDIESCRVIRDGS